MPDLVRPVDAADLPIMERLWQLFRHDLSEFTELLPNPDGTFGGNRLHTAFTDADRAPHLLMSDNSPVGFVVVRALLAPTRVLNAFFVVRGARRKGIGLQAVRDVTTKYPGRWEVAFQDTNVNAARFWRRVAADIADEAWTEEHRPVPNRPDLPPDAWISFSVPA
ncbi:GNAT family N-acetyltransferase [Streptomyces sp. NPDC001635]